MKSNSKVLEIELHPVYKKEVESHFKDVNKAMSEAIQYFRSAFSAASDKGITDVSKIIGNLQDWKAQFRVHVACEYYRQVLASEAFSFVLTLCDHLKASGLNEGGRYNVARCYAHLGCSARQSGQIELAVKIANMGISLIDGLPYRAVSSNLFYNLGVALEHSADFDGASNAYEKASEIDRILKR